MGARTLVARLLNQSLVKGETRTNWRKRPLSQRQLEYALQDVVHLQTLRDVPGDRVLRVEEHRQIPEVPR